MKSLKLPMTLVVLALAAATVFPPNASAQADRQFRTSSAPEPARPALPTPPLQPLVHNVLPRSMQGAEALTALGAGVLPVVATQNGQSVEALTKLMTNDSSAWLDVDGRLFFRDPPPPTMNLTSGLPALGPFPNSQSFRLHSKPGSTRVMYLDFNGYNLPAGTLWRNGTAYTALPYDTDGDGTRWSQAELDVVQNTWQRVSEDYAPFDIDVTTEDPGYDAINRSAVGDDVFGGRVVITNTPDPIFCGGRCGGVSYVGTIDDIGASHDSHQPSWAFTSGVGFEARFLSEVISHEFGHEVGLSHDGTSLGVEYYEGHGMWAPIMGVGYYQPVVQWSKGEYTNANNTEDDFAVVVSNTVRLIPDESPGVLNPPDDLVPGATRLIGATSLDGDIDAWRYVAPCSGTYTFTAKVADLSPNLSVEFQLYNYGGALIQDDSTQPVRVSDDVATGMDGTITADLVAGSAYTLGMWPLANGNASTGWTNYANVGRYSIEVATPCPTAPTPNCRFASSVLGFSSQHTMVSGSAQQALGPPDLFPTYGDIGSAWASSNSGDPREFLDLGFANPAPINFVNVYETLNPGAIQAISVRNPNTGLLEVVWTGTPAAAPASSRMFTATFPVTAFPVSEVVVDVASDLVPGWNEIDAVGIGYRDLAAASQWASSVVDFSSQFSTTVWSAQQALGPPDLYPQYGDAVLAWASATQDDQREFLDLAYATPSAINFVNVVETWAPGALDQVSVKNPRTGLFEQVWSGTAAAAPPAARINTISFPEPNFLVGEVRLDFNSPVVPDWNEVDAVGIGRCACQSSPVAVPTTGNTSAVSALEWARPNPFSISTGIGFSLARGGQAKVEIFNLLGQRVRSLVDRTLPAGRHNVQWDGRDAGGRTVANGVYYLRLETDGLSESRKIVKIQ